MTPAAATESPKTSRVDDFGAAYAAEQLRRSRHPLRRFVKGFYLRHALADVRGAAIDFGCGAGQLLARMPPGSVGLEVNPHLIGSLRARGLQVVEGFGDARDLDLGSFEAGRFGSVVISHVLEHLDDPAAALRRLLGACSRLAIGRLIVIVPGAKGFRSDATHRTFIDEAFFDAHALRRVAGFSMRGVDYFPGNRASLGQHLTFHETKAVFDRGA